jgi:hypothetical protein
VQRRESFRAAGLDLEHQANVCWRSCVHRGTSPHPQYIWQSREKVIKKDTACVHCWSNARTLSWSPRLFPPLLIRGALL